MRTKEEIAAEILSVVTQRTGGSRPCSLCGTDDWLLVDKYVRLAVHKDPNVGGPSGRGMPLVAIVCKRCGNTHLLNLIALGYDDEKLKTLVLPEEADGK